MIDTTDVRQAVGAENPDDFWYVLRVRLGGEERVRNALEVRLDANLHLPFIPTKKYPFRLKKEEKQQEIKPQDQICFPGYVFVRSQVEQYAFIRKVAPTLNYIKEAHFFAYYGSDNRDIAMRPHERSRIDALMDRSFNIGVSKGFVEGDRIIVIEGPLVGLEGMILRLDRHSIQYHH